jgi:hypothetical protein
MDLVERCERVLAQNTESASVRGWRDAIAAAQRGDGAGAAEAVGALPEKPRFAATIVLGLAFPSVLVATAQAYDAAVPAGTVALDWQRCCEHLTVMRWAERARELEPRVLASLLNRAYYGAAGLALLAAIRDRVRANDLATARALYDEIPKFAKEERGAACALLGIATNDVAEMRAALAVATCKPIIQDGGEEAEALAAVLAEFAAAELPPDHEVVLECLKVLAKWAETRHQKDVRSYGVALAAQTCVRAKWMDHARALLEVIWDPRNRAPVEEAVASGRAAKAPQRKLDEPTHEDIVAEKLADRRIEKATARALGRLDANDRDAALAAMHAALAAGDASAGTATPEARVAWARALAAGGRRDEAIAVLTALLPDGLPRVGCELAVELLGTDARAFVEAALAHELELVTFSMSTNDPPAALYLAQLVARTSDPELECALIKAVAVVRKYEDSDGTNNSSQRIRRITETLRVLAGAYPELADATPTRERLDAWTAALGDHEASRGMIGGAAAALAAEPLDAIIKRCGGAIHPKHVPALAAEIARRGRLADALAVVAEHEPRTQQPAYVAIARTITTPADRKKLVATFKKSKKTGRDRDAQGMWKFNLGTILLACDDVDGAIAVVSDMQDVRYSGYQPSDLARAFAKQLDASNAWTADRAAALAKVLGGPGIIHQDVRGAIFAVGPAAVAHHAERTNKPLASTRAKLGRPGDAALVDAIEALGHLRANDRDRGVAQLAKAIEQALAGESIYVASSDFVWCAAQLPRDVPERATLFARAFQHLKRHRPDDAKRAIERIFANLDPQDAPLAASTLAVTELPHESTTVVHDQLGELVAELLDDAALLPLEAATDPVTATRRVQQAARHLARRGQHASAMKLAHRCGY